MAALILQMQNLISTQGMVPHQNSATTTQGMVPNLGVAGYGMGSFSAQSMVLAQGTPAPGNFVNTYANTAPSNLQTEVSGVSQKTLDAAVRGEFIDINEFLPSIMATSHLPLTDIEPYLDSNGMVCYKQKRSTRKIANFSTWTEAWTRYQKHLVKHLRSEVHSSMADYFIFILESDKKYSWSAIAILDFKHRLSLGKKGNFADLLAFEVVDPLMLLTVLDASSLKPNAIKCKHCSGYDYMSI
jgi:hypothetical protein